MTLQSVAIDSATGEPAHGPESSAPAGTTPAAGRLRFVSVIIPTIGRPAFLSRLLESLVTQTRRPDQVIVSDGSGGSEIREVVERPDWGARSLPVEWIAVQPPNAVRQRKAAIQRARGDALLLLDDDVVLEADCLEQMLASLEGHPERVAVTADFNNQTWPGPTRMWRWYLKMQGVGEGEWQGRVLGPLLRFGYFPSPKAPMPMQWLGAGNSLIWKNAYDGVGGFSDFFLHRCTMNEDVDLGLKLSRVGQIVLCPSARMAHLHAPGGRVAPRLIAEDDLYNRYLVLRQTLHRSAPTAFAAVMLFFLVETTSGAVGAVRRRSPRQAWENFSGRLRALVRIVCRGVRSSE